MSSDESGCEETTDGRRIEVWVPRRMPWRHDFDATMDIIDAVRPKPARGPKPKPRNRAPPEIAPVSGRPPVLELPRAFYDKEWIKKQNRAWVHTILRSKEDERYNWVPFMDA